MYIYPPRTLTAAVMGAVLLVLSGLLLCSKLPQLAWKLRKPGLEVARGALVFRTAPQSVSL